MLYHAMLSYSAAYYTCSFSFLWCMYPMSACVIFFSRKFDFISSASILNLTLSPSFRLTASTVKWVAMWYVWCYLKSYIFWYNLTMRLLISYLDRTFLKLTPVSSFLSNRLTTLTSTECVSYECFERLHFKHQYLSKTFFFCIWTFKGLFHKQSPR